MFGFFATPLGKIVLWGVGIIALIAVFFTAKHIYDSSIEAKALLAWNKAQLEEVVNAQNKYIEQLNKVFEEQKRISENLERKLDNFQKTVDDIDDFINSTEVEGKDKESSEILKETIRRLRGSQ